MQILKVVLYGKNGKRRDVDFTPSAVNIVTGASKKGKSSLLDIVEYCLGSSECTVAEGHIRQTVAWYAVLLIFPDTEVFIARAAPMQGMKANTACHMLIEKNVEVPDSSEVTNTTNISSVVDYLTSKVGIPEQITEVPEGQTRANIQVEFKHSRYYLFQGQDEVAAKRTLFHRQAEPFIPQAIKDTLPYFMGAAEDSRLAELESLRNLKRDKTKLIKQIKEIESIRGEGLQKGYDLLSEASNVGLYSGNLLLSDKKLLDVLSVISTWTPSESMEDEVNGDPLYELDAKYRGFAERKRIVRSKLRAANEYAGSLGGFEGELNEQSLRLQSIGLYKNAPSATVCSICEAEHEEAKSAEIVINNAVAELDSKLEGVLRNKPRIVSYLNSLKEEDRQLAENIKKTRDAMDTIRRKEAELSTKAKLDDRRSRVVGRVSLYRRFSR